MKASVTTAQLAEAAGTSRTMIDYWAAHRVLTPLNPRPGSGNPREWSADLLPLARYLGQTQRGLGEVSPLNNSPKTNVTSLRRIAEHYHRGSLELGPDVRLSWAATP